MPTAATECPYCSGLIHVVLRRQPSSQIMPDGELEMRRNDRHCPHCGSRIWTVFRGRAPIALPTKPGTGALMPKTHVNNKTTRRTRAPVAPPVPDPHADTRTDPPPPPPLT